jgi:nicotinate-nucleotide--dimethylbenzimidazole phosphoribosyltransferase
MKHFELKPFQIEAVRADIVHEARQRQSQLTKPMGSLGRLESIAVQLAAIQRTQTPEARDAQCLIFAADHPVVMHGVSAFPAAVTPAMVHNIINGGAASSVLAAKLDVPIEIVDVGVNNLDGVRSSSRCAYHRVTAAANGAVGDLTTASAMSQDTFVTSVQAGIDAVDRASDCRVLILGELGIGNTTVAASVCAHLLDGTIESLVGRGTGVDDTGLERKFTAVQAALHATSAVTPAQTIQQIGGREVAAMYGAIGRAAEKGIAVLVDGYVVAAAALALIQTYPNAADYVLWSHCSQEQGHAAVLSALGAQSLLDLELRLGEASGALTAFTLLELACEIHCQMATFDDAAVPNRDT